MIAEYEYDGVGFRVAHLPAPESRRLSLRILRSFGGALEGVAGGKVDAMRAAIGILHALTEPDFDAIVVAFTGATTVRLPPDPRALAAMPNVDPSKAAALWLPLRDCEERAFGSGKLARLYAWLAFALGHEYKDFFADISSGKLATLLVGETAS